MLLTMTKAYKSTDDGRAAVAGHPKLTFLGMPALQFASQRYSGRMHNRM